MNIKVDESVDQQIVARLRDDGHDVLYVAEIDLLLEATAAPIG